MKSDGIVLNQQSDELNRVGYLVMHASDAHFKIRLAIMQKLRPKAKGIEKVGKSCIRQYIYLPKARRTLVSILKREIKAYKKAIEAQQLADGRVSALGHTSYMILHQIFCRDQAPLGSYDAMGERSTWNLPVESLVWEECRNGTKRAATIDGGNYLIQRSPQGRHAELEQWILTHTSFNIRRVNRTVDVCKIEAQRDWEEHLLPFLKVPKAPPVPKVQQFTIVGAKHGVMALRHIVDLDTVYVIDPEVFSEIYMSGKQVGTVVDLLPCKVIRGIRDGYIAYHKAERQYCGLD